MKLLPVLLLALSASSFAETPSPALAKQDMAKAANALLESLSPELKAKVSFPFSTPDKDERLNWHFVPKERKGLPLKDMSDSQKALARGLLRTGLSEDGIKKAESIQNLEVILKELEKDTVGRRDPDKYFVSIFGTPGGKEPWGWRWEGHHQSFNYTCPSEGTPSMTPSFFGSNPGTIPAGERKGELVLAAEENVGRELVKSLSDEQRKVAVIMEKAPGDIFNVPGRKDTKPEGIPYSQLNEEQKNKLVALTRLYLFRCRPDVAASDWARVEKAGLDKLHFAWAGSLEEGKGHYYRVQAGNFVLEYDNVQNNANHPHTQWRDFDRDFGMDVLADHYREAHGEKK